MMMLVLYIKSNAMGNLKNKMTQFANILIRMEWLRKKNLFYFTTYLRIAVTALTSFNDCIFLTPLFCVMKVSKLINLFAWQLSQLPAPCNSGFRFSFYWLLICCNNHCFQMIGFRKIFFVRAKKQSGTFLRRPLVPHIIGHH